MLHMFVWVCGVEVGLDRAVALLIRFVGCADCRKVILRAFLFSTFTGIFESWSALAWGAETERGAVLETHCHYKRLKKCLFKFSQSFSLCSAKAKMENGFNMEPTIHKNPLYFRGKWGIHSWLSSAALLNMLATSVFSDASANHVFMFVMHCMV